MASSAGGVVTWDGVSLDIVVIYSTPLSQGQTDLITFSSAAPSGGFSSDVFTSFLNGIPGLSTTVPAAGTQTVSHSTVTSTSTRTATPGELRIMGQAVVPNPVVGDELSFYIKLSAPATRIHLRIFTESSRKIRDTDLYPDPSIWMAYERYQAIGRQDALGNGLANGMYHYVLDVYQGDSMLDTKIGTFFVLR